MNFTFVFVSVILTLSYINETGRRVLLCIVQQCTSYYTDDLLE